MTECYIIDYVFFTAVGVIIGVIGCIPIMWALRKEANNNYKGETMK